MKSLAGVGKTIMSYVFLESERRSSPTTMVLKLTGQRSIIIANLEKAIQTREAREVSRLACIYVYFDYQERDRQTPMRVLANILMQLVHHRGHCTSELMMAFKKYHTQNESLGKDEYLRLIISELSIFREVYLVLDALDECPHDSANNNNSAFLTVVAQLPPTVKVLFSSRPDPIFHQPLPAELQINITVKPQDLRDLVNSRIERSEGLQKLVEEGTKRRAGFREFICEAIISRSQET
jgi:hypothetical protein